MKKAGAALRLPGTTFQFHVTQGEALLTFYRQLLIGDSSDNIPGCYKLGKATAKDLLPIALREEEM